MSTGHAGVRNATLRARSAPALGTLLQCDGGDVLPGGSVDAVLRASLDPIIVGRLFQVPLIEKCDLHRKAAQWVKSIVERQRNGPKLPCRGGFTEIIVYHRPENFRAGKSIRPGKSKPLEGAHGQEVAGVVPTTVEDYEATRYEGLRRGRGQWVGTMRRTVSLDSDSTMLIARK
jgi:hypothetical protein